MHTVERVRQALSAKGLSLYQVSRRSAQIFGRPSPYFIPERLYHDLGRGAVPSIRQFTALSQISRFRLSDWLEVFGFRLDDIPKLQLLISRRNTVILDSSVYNDERWVSWFTDRLPKSPRAVLTPLEQILQPGLAKRAKQLLLQSKRRFLYAKVGRDDPFAFPSLAPGSIARIDVGTRPDFTSTSDPSTINRLFLVETGLFLHCGPLRRVRPGKIQLYSTEFPFAQLDVSPGRGARIVGAVDAEIRILSSSQEKEISPTPQEAVSTIARDSRAGLQVLLRASRARAGMSYREASRLSRWVAGALADPMYFTAPGTLSDYESSSVSLHHVQKLFLLCILYCIDFWTFLRAADLPVDSLGNDPLPTVGPYRSPTPSQVSGTEAGIAPDRGVNGGFLSSFMDRWQELPLFLKDSLSELFRLDISLANIFWTGKDPDPIHPALAGASLLVVDRRVRAPKHGLAATVWQEPLYVILLRDGSYLCGACTLRHGILTVHPHSERPYSSIHLRNRVDGELIGQVTGIVRRLSQV